MRGEHLTDALAALAAERAALVTARGTRTLAALRADAAALAARLQLPAASRVALCGLDVDGLVDALIGLDGRVGALLLLPPGLSAEVERQLVDAAGCTHGLRPGMDGAEPVPGATVPCGHEPATQHHQATRWLLATSGTTGTPKIIAHDFATLARTTKRDPVRGATQRWGLLYDANRFAGLQVLLQALLGGSMLVAAGAPGNLAAHLEALLAHRVNALSATPTLWRKLLMDGRVAALPLAQITLGGEIADPAVLRALRQRFPAARIVHIYASTEAGAAFAVHDEQAGFPAAWLHGQGAPLPMRLRSDSHLLLRPGVLPQGDEVAARLDADGFLDTQDLVCVQGERALFLGRASGAINVGGNKAVPEEIEGRIREVDGVVDARVFGRSSSVMGQIVAAEIVVAPGRDPKTLRVSVMQHCRSRMPAWQVPAMIAFVDQLRETAAGKKERAAA